MDYLTKFLPMVALRGVVVLPFSTATVEVAREKSLLALNYALENDSELFVAAQKDASVGEPNEDGIFGVGTVCKIKQVMRLPSDITRVVVQGLHPARITAYVPKKFLFVEVNGFGYRKEKSVETESLMRTALGLFDSYKLVAPRTNSEIFAFKPDFKKPNHFVNFAASYLFSFDLKQQLLEDDDTEQRLLEICGVLDREIEVVKVDKRIAQRVKKSIDKNQKEFYLKEQMKAISDELGESDDDIAELEQKVADAKMPKEIEEKAKKELRRLSKMSTSSPDASIVRTYVDWLTEIKWEFETKDNTDMKKAKDVLNEDHYGLEKIKERILEYLAVIQLSGNMKGPILCFVGPPGVGKTSIVKSIARALGRKYVRMSLGGVRDEAEIRGHRRTYVGAIPGKIIYLLKQAGSKNPVFLFDEIEKMSSDFRGDPTSAMLEVLDPEQNYAFVDHYMEVPVDLSKVLFVATANTVDSIPAPLLDRMEVIELTGYTDEEKLEIAQRFLVGKQKEAHGLKENSVIITEPALRMIINNYTRESGVRNLEREIAHICRKTALKIIEEQPSDAVVISPNNLGEFLGAEKFKNDFLNKEDEVGSATGLAWTSVGGTTLTIEVTLFEGKGEILLTGQLGDVMKESARTAISLVRSKADEFKIDAQVFNKTDIHIHVPEGAIPKDGPSAGITMATAILSAFTNRPVSKNVAMTGEITLRGRVLPIGGLKEKTLAAFRAGFTTVIIPKENEKDVTDIPKNVRDKIDIILTDNIGAVFEHALV